MDIFEKYLEQEAAGSGVASNGVAPIEIDAPLEPMLRNGYRTVGVKPGMTVNHFTVVGPALRQGTHGTYSNREYIVRCVCGTRRRVTYHQIYYGSAYSCGCIQRRKHPPIKLEGQRIGRVEVLRWSDDGWELVCHECGALIYRMTTYQVRAAGKTCDSHGVITA